MGQRLRQERKRLALSQSEFAKVVGVHLNTQSRYERGEREPDVSYLAAASKIGVDVTYVLTETRRNVRNFGVDEFNMAHFGLAVAKLNRITPYQILGVVGAANSTMNKPRYKNLSSDESVVAYEEAFLLAVAELFSNMPPQRNGDLTAISEDVDGSILSTVLVNIDSVCTTSRIELSSRKKAGAAAMLYRIFKAGGKVNPKIIEEVLVLAAG